MSKFEQIKWRDPDGNLIACVEKIKVMRENLEELQQMAQDCLENALLMQCDKRQVRQVLHQLIDSLHNPYMGE